MVHITQLQKFVDQYKTQLLSSGIPETYWEPLYKKLLYQTFDAGECFQLVKIEYDEPKQPHEPLWGLQALRDLSNKEENIFLIDHAWTYQISQARNHLQYSPLRSRLANILGLNDELNSEELIEQIFDNMWRINCTYTVKDVKNGEQNQMWYVMDEIGCAVQHRDIPNCRIVPFFTSEGAYSLLFLLLNVEDGDLLYRDFAEGINDPVARKVALSPWVPISFEDFPTDVHIPSEDYFTSGHIPETLPDLSQFNCSDKEEKEKYYVYTQYDLIKQFLSDQKFEITSDEDKADILWYTEHFRDFETLSKNPKKFVNQFPYEYVITVKDLLCMTCRRFKNNTYRADWMPVTYNLVNEIGNFANYFHKNPGKFWIIKPYNLARGMDIHITQNFNYIMRLPCTGPKIAQEYLTNPVLFYRNDCEGQVKFDLRYVILLKKVRPLQAYVFKEFFLRFANKPFDLSHFDDYEKHFTVMNYTENAQLKHLKCEDFKKEWSKQYMDYHWDAVEGKILEMLREILDCATVADAPCGIAENPQSRALYAADLMLDWTETKEIQPKILEINYMPDCQRACDYYPDFFNDIFKLLFLNVEKNDIFYKL
ncbi:hypothetical protein ABEB36_002917 [Hypothenemus hampei]|uniref:Tubulin--tyrosine ligase-like protein 12 SET-like domain-containing protein n=1 Tax=Hypothenemus hampei TaxID=57062 RepID=A0ABD1FA28_HYPHA